MPMSAGRCLGRCLLGSALLASLAAAGCGSQATGEEERDNAAGRAPGKPPDNRQDSPMICRNLTKGNVVASHLVVADTWETRRKGFLGRTSIEPGEGMLLTPCFAIHMIGMKFALDVVFLDRGNRVVGIDTHVKPGTLNSSCRKARSTLELPAGTVAAKHIEKGDVLQILRADEAKEKGAEKGEEK